MSEVLPVENEVLGLQKGHLEIAIRLPQHEHLRCVVKNRNVVKDRPRQQRTALKNDRKSGWEEKEEGNAKTVFCGRDIRLGGRGAIPNATPCHAPGNNISPRLAPSFSQFWDIVGEEADACVPTSLEWALYHTVSGHKLTGYVRCPRTQGEQ
jgi:hypothetical protein